MLKTKAKWFNMIWGVLDLIIISTSFYMVFWFRFNWLPVFYGSRPDLSTYIIELFLFIVIWLLSAWSSGLYTSKRVSSSAADWRPVFVSTGLAVLAFAAVSFLIKPLDISRLMLAIFAVWIILVLGIWHQLVRMTLAHFRALGYNQRRALIVGGGELARRVETVFEQRPWYGFKVDGYCSNNGVPADAQAPLLGSISQLSEILSKHTIDRVMLTLPLNQKQQIRNVANICEFAGVELNIVPDLFELVQPRTKVFELDGMPVVGIRNTPVDTFQYQWVKRLFDIVFSFFALLILSPLFALVATAIKLTSRGPVFFVQKRISYNGEQFDFYKFRTMQQQPESVSDTTWTQEKDVRVTPVGAFLRKTCLDELPQFWNVLKGDMSIVGPRPERPHFIEQFKQDIPGYMMRHVVRAGITGWAQIHGLRGDTSIERRIEYDLFYIENWSFLLDLAIILKTPFKGFWNKHAY
ncbi:MAG: undecaprenyl-phosphate glucose phosphotransferase [candidate division KSB1 bacterium]|nr:undecaprenyl-phosphate glucose phosphotransferase [candidate division KSB1 bacterium]